MVIKAWRDSRPAEEEAADLLAAQQAARAAAAAAAGAASPRRGSGAHWSVQGLAPACGLAATSPKPDTNALVCCRQHLCFGCDCYIFQAKKNPQLCLPSFLQAQTCCDRVFFAGDPHLSEPWIGNTRPAKVPQQEGLTSGLGPSPDIFQPQ